MGYFLKKHARTTRKKGSWKTSWKCAGEPTRPKFNVVAGMLVRQKEICFYLRWANRGRPKADEKRGPENPRALGGGCALRLRRVRG